jgi:hypothetical protein
MAFFGTACSEPPRNNNKFGLRDDPGQTKAYSTVTDPEKWVATVVNADRGDVVFTAIDNCLMFIKQGTKSDKESTCEGMLTKRDKLHLVELKEWDYAEGALERGMGQLENTIKLLKAHENIDAFIDRKAHVCNQRHPAATIVATANRKFLKATGFRLGVRATITI